MVDNVTLNANTPAQVVVRASNNAGVFTPHSDAELWVASAPVTNTNPIPIMPVLANGTVAAAGANATPVLENNSANIAIQVANVAVQVANDASLVSNVGFLRLGSGSNIPGYALVNNLAANADIVTANNTKQIRVLSMALSTTGGLVTVTVRANTTPLTGNLSVHVITNTAPCVLPFNPAGWFQTPSTNQSIRFEMNNANVVSGSLTWVAI
jgi:hypothetical protein